MRISVLLICFCSMVHRFKCRFLELNCVNSLPQTSQAYGFTPVCVRMCAVKTWFLPNALPHMSQQCDFTPVCMRRCWVKTSFLLNNLPHWSHLCDFTPVCMRRCLIKSLFRANNFPHWSHLWVFSPVWVSWCPFRVPLSTKDLPHTSQEKGFSHVCVCVCLVSSDFVEHLYSQREEEKGFLCICVRTCVCMCWIRSETNLNVFPQGAHRNGEWTSSSWVRICWKRDSVSAQTKEHWEHGHIFVTSKLFVPSSSADCWDWTFEFELAAVSSESQAVCPITY